MKPALKRALTLASKVVGAIVVLGTTIYAMERLIHLQRCKRCRDREAANTTTTEEGGEANV